MATVEQQRVKLRAFLDAATTGDLDEVERWLSSDGGGDVNRTLGEGWTALLYAVANGRLHIVRRLLQEETADLNATTILGSSALSLALARKSNTMTALLLTSGASRSTLPSELWQELQTASWIREDVQEMLSPEWTVTWSPTLHRHFPPGEREKCRLVVYANALAQRRTGAGWRGEAMQWFWWLVAALTGRLSMEDRHVRWKYLPQQLVDHIIEYAVYLW